MIAGTEKKPIFIERSFLSTLVFSKIALNQNRISKEEHALLEEMVQQYQSKLKVYWHRTFFLECDVSTSYERIKERARNNECLCKQDVEDLIEAYKSMKDASSISLNSTATVHALKNMILEELNI